MHRGLLTAVLLLTPAAHAVFLRGHVTSALGRPVPGARIQLIQGPRSVADTISGADGAWEIRSDLAGRFVVLTSSAHFAPQVGYPFYAGRTDLLTLDIALDPTLITPQVSAQMTGFETPMAQLSALVSQVTADQLLTQASVAPEVRTLPSATLLHLGQTGAPALLLVRGAPAPALETLVDGVPANDLSSTLTAGAFNLATASSTGLSGKSSPPALELTPVPVPLHFADAESAVLALHTMEGASLHAALVYAGDAGGLGAYRNEATVTATHTRADALVSFGRFDQSGDPALPAPFHLATSAANLGYRISGSTSLRFKLRDEVSAAPRTLPFDFFGVQPAGKEAEQNLYSTFTFDTRTAGNWHNQLSAGVVRKRAETLAFATPVVGLPVTIAGANGYSVTGAALFPRLPRREDTVTNRDVLTYTTDAPVLQNPAHSLSALLSLRLEKERAADILPASRRDLARQHLSGAAALQGQIGHRLFAQLSGFLDHANPFGWAGSPALGITYVPVFPAMRAFHGTSLHALASAGQREPTLQQQASVNNVVNARARTLEVSADQTLFSERLVVRGAYFHNQFSHEPEPLTLAADRSVTYGQTLAFRSQGLASSFDFHPVPRVLLAGGYTYLAALVERSATVASFNAAVSPAAGSQPIGALSALPGARPFFRPPHSGFLLATYSGPRLAASVKAALQGRSDSSTFLVQTPNLLLPNKDLSPGFVALDANLTYSITHRIAAYTQMTNLLDDRHMGPLGFRSSPFQIRAGLRFTIRGD